MDWPAIDRQLFFLKEKVSNREKGLKACACAKHLAIVGLISGFGQLACQKLPGTGCQLLLEKQNVTS